MRPLPIVCMGLVLLAACGQKGPLVRPPPARQSGVPTPGPQNSPAAEPAAPTPEP